MEVRVEIQSIRRAELTSTGLGLLGISVPPQVFRFVISSMEPRRSVVAGELRTRPEIRSFMRRRSVAGFWMGGCMTTFHPGNRVVT